MRKWILLTVMIYLVVNPEGISLAREQEETVPSRPILWLFVETAIHPVTALYIEKGIERAKEIKAQAIVLQLNTPGGLVTSADLIIQNLLQSPIPVIGYVAPSGAHAASAGFFILMATDLAAMAPGTRTGAAAPIIGSGGGEDNENTRTLRKKQENDLIALMKSLTRRRGRNTKLALSTIREAKAFDEKEALDKGLIELIARDRQDLLNQLEDRKIKLWSGKTVTLSTKNARVIDYPMPLHYQLLSFIMDPNIIFILFTLGMLGIYIELSHPGLILPGLVGVICLILALVSSQIMPISWGAVVLIAIAFFMFLLELKVTSFGLLTIGGLILLAIGGMMLSDTPLGEWQVSRALLLSVVLSIGVIVGLILFLVVRTYRHRPMTGTEGLIGSLGWAESDFAEGETGWVFVDGSLWQAVAEGKVKKGMRVEVVGIEDGMILHVKPHVTHDQPGNGEGRD